MSTRGLPSRHPPGHRAPDEILGRGCLRGLPGANAPFCRKRLREFNIPVASLTCGQSGAGRNRRLLGGRRPGSWVKAAVLLSCGRKSGKRQEALASRPFSDRGLPPTKSCVCACVYESAGLRACVRACVCAPADVRECMCAHACMVACCALCGYHTLRPEGCSGLCRRRDTKMLEALKMSFSPHPRHKMI